MKARARKFLSALTGFFIFIGVGLLPTHAQDVIRLTVATGLPQSNPVLAEINRTFAPAVDEELKRSGSKYKIDWIIGHAGTIVKLPAMMQAVSDGVVDMGMTTQALEQSKMPLQNVVYYIPFGTTDHRIAGQVFDETQQSVGAMSVWSKFNTVYLASFPFDRYILMSKQPIRSVDDLRGKKVGGIGPNLLWLTSTGAVGVVANFGTAYDDLQSGKYDLTFMTPLNAASTKVYEVAPYFIDAGFGSMSVVVFLCNKARWDRLPSEVQAALKTGIERWKSAYLDNLDSQIDPAIKMMEKAGATIIALPPEERKRWAHKLPPLAAEWANQMQSKGLPGKQVVETYMGALRKRDVQLVRDWAAP
jgi:TRAP-type C4-dicarboxylate transport system substrate-binding protein